MHFIVLVCNAIAFRNKVFQDPSNIVWEIHKSNMISMSWIIDLISHTVVMYFSFINCPRIELPEKWFYLSLIVEIVFYCTCSNTLIMSLWYYVSSQCSRSIMFWGRLYEAELHIRLMCPTSVWLPGWLADSQLKTL